VIAPPSVISLIDERGSVALALGLSALLGLRQAIGAWP
jgi:hypothetical protein